MTEHEHPEVTTAEQLTAEMLVSVLYEAARLGQRMPPFDPHGTRRADLPLARIANRFLLRLLADAGVRPDSATGLQLLRLCWRTVAIGSRRAGNPQHN